MMKFIPIILLSLVCFVAACHDGTVGYLLTKDAAYDPDTIIIRQIPDPVLDATRIKNNAPWVSLKMQGYVGTEPISFTIETVTSESGNIEAARQFQEELTTRGGGVLLYPLEPKNKVPTGRYKVSVRLTNEGHSEVVEDAITFIVK